VPGRLNSLQGHDLGQGHPFAPSAPPFVRSDDSIAVSLYATTVWEFHWPGRGRWQEIGPPANKSSSAYWGESQGKGSSPTGGGGAEQPPFVHGSRPGHPVWYCRSHRISACGRRTVRSAALIPLRRDVSGTMRTSLSHPVKHTSLQCGSSDEAYWNCFSAIQSEFREIALRSLRWPFAPPNQRRESAGIRRGHLGAIDNTDCL
jgi:hypothetical protein